MRGPLQDLGYALRQLPKTPGLAAVGSYGLISSAAAQRTRESGIRVALGFSIRPAMLNVGRSGFEAVSSGLIVGIAASLWRLRLLRSQLYDIRFYDPVAFAVVPLVIVGVAAVASFLPGWRIATQDPAETLRNE